MKKIFHILSLLFLSILTFAQRPMEHLDRGLVALERNDGVIFLSWRILGTDAPEVGFNIYRNGTKITGDTPYTLNSNFEDSEGTVEDSYVLETIYPNGNKESSEAIKVWPADAGDNGNRTRVPLKRIPLPEQPGSPWPDGHETQYIPGDMSVGDLNGDGTYELVFEWEGVSPHIDAIDLDGNHLWRINLGCNVTYNACGIMVYDLDGDGKAEVALTTGPGTIDGTGSYLSTGPAANDDDLDTLRRVNISLQETLSGNLVEDPQYFTVFDGETGKELATMDLWPAIGRLHSWGDTYGKRSGSIKAAVLYNKELGQPLLVYTRGIYSRVGMGAYSWDGKELKRVWTFDSETSGNSGYRGQGNHAVAVGDVDGDGSDELLYGACAIDHDGTGLYTTRYGHGDAHSLGDLMPERPGMEFFQVHENNVRGISMRDAATGEILWKEDSSGDIGRGWAADITTDYKGAEIMTVLNTDNARDCKGNILSISYNAFNQPLYFDGDVQKEMRSGASVEGPGRILTGWYYGASTIHSTKNDANLVADILGDWREEMIFTNGDYTELIVFSSWFYTYRKNYTLMHDPTYRMCVTTQNVGYNQPADVGYYFPDGAPAANISEIQYSPDTVKAGELPVVNFSVASQTNANEKNSMTFTVQLSAVSDQDVTVPFMVNDSSTASSTGRGADYSITESPLVIPAGKTSATIHVTVIDDAQDENNETIVVDMGDVVNAQKGTHVSNTLTITDDDHTPYFVVAPESLSVDEMAENGTLVGAVKAKDDDRNSVLYYAITSGNTNNAFAIDPSTGKITVNNKDALDYETTPIFNLTLKVNDRVNQSEPVTIQITLNDVIETGIVDNLEVNKVIYPNPAHDFLFIEMPEMNISGSTLEVFSIAGQKVMERRITKSKEAFSIKALQTGVYVVKIRNSETVISHTIIKM